MKNNNILLPRNACFLVENKFEEQVSKNISKEYHFTFNTLMLLFFSSAGKERLKVIAYFNRLTAFPMFKKDRKHKMMWVSIKEIFK